ncbi:hypothetical protein INT43_004320 [Umbelopsis isabellina]|uniref:UBZ4-type domain-containing protein n=1 Tax=Mortierella isabellina TaxID=91625 RepID=A0A8H7PHV9_MORIS|nr:hypothetical protein INT43_004320 [Umbelopsis isabellina]
MKRARANRDGTLTQKRLKDNKDKNVGGSDQNGGMTLIDFFKNQPQQPACDTAVEDRFEKDIELAIKLSMDTCFDPMQEPSCSYILDEPDHAAVKKEDCEVPALSTNNSSPTSANTSDIAINQTESKDDRTFLIENKQEEAIGHSESLLSCPICNKPLDKLSHDQTEEHVNTCLDEPTPTDIKSIATPSPSPPESEASSLTEEQKKAQASSWTQFFGNLHSKISGVWSAQTDQAPGMRGNSSTQQWFGEDRKPNVPPVRGAPRKCPFYKRLPGTTLTVDAFSYGKVEDCTGYFLSHFHSDHYTRLSSNWRHGPIYCSKVTANLVAQQLRVDAEWIRPLPMDVECKIEDSDVTVTLIDANHCPGSAILLFKVPQPNGNKPLRYLHTGDFRACPKMCLHPEIIQPLNSYIDILYLDTTYLNPRYAFPAQEESIKAACDIVLQKVLKTKSTVSEDDDDPGNPRLESFFSTRSCENDKNSGSEVTGSDKDEGQLVKTDLKEEEVEEAFKSFDGEDMDDFDYNDDFLESVDQAERNSDSMSSSLDLETTDWNNAENQSPESAPLYQNQTLVVVGTYSIGKEKIFLEIAKQLNSKIFVTAAKRRILLCQENKELEAMLTDNPRKAGVHVVPLWHLKADNLSAYLKSMAPTFTTILAFRPTGWTFRSSSAQTTDMNSSSLAYITSQKPAFSARSLRPTYSSPSITIYGVPYSEHSSFRELAAFIGSLDIKRIVPTVNVGSESSRRKMGNFFRKWEAEKRSNGKIEVVPYRVVDHW